MILQRKLLVLLVAIASISQTALAQDNSKVVLGRLGKVLQATAVFTQPDPTSKAYFSVEVETILVIKTDAPKGWSKVLLNNRRYGYIPADSVQPLDWQVTGDASGRQTTSPLASRSSSGGRASAADRGLDYLGTPYKWGGNDIENGIDCSGFVKKLYGSIGVSLPRTAAEQALIGQPITKLEDLQKGDRLYFWESKRGKIGHTGIYLGNGQFVHSSSGHHGVNVDNLTSGNWLKILVAARR